MIRYIILLSIFLAGIWLIAFSLSPLDNQTHSETWQTAQAVITSSEIKKHQTRRKAPGSSKYKTRITYQPRLTYVYAIDGSEYQGDRLDFSHRSYSDMQVAKKVQGTYPVGREIEIFYNPENPSESVIIRDGKMIFPLTFFGILLSSWAAWRIVKPLIGKKF
ncbi:hypothetical protein DDZ13_13005 [Coraliomargarita sinensis]|uniref:DUF3592 domain-containing protein n=2 Tax=Coraliomargarita sinensis TaxID=2174842 RepID=A0A317ZDH1_9BACT|nr:hypothetical protein DDZ13_13005 [Coraliomargarita sinensis]